MCGQASAVTLTKVPAGCAVVREWGGHGIGRALINGVYERAQLAGSSRVYWLTHNTNSTAMLLYDKVADNSGFVVYRKIF